MNSIDPVYYAAGSYTARFEVNLRSIEYLPEGAIAVMSNRNENPTRYVGEVSNPNDVPISSIEGNVVVFEQPSSHQHNSPCYLGCIITADRSQVLWVNNTRPLPE